MAYDFDQRIDRRRSESAKWHRYDEDVLPMWLADMDFRSPAPVIQALHERVEHGVFGYSWPPPELRQVIVERLQRLYGWQVSPEALVFVPGVVTGFNLACHAVTSPDDGVLIQTPAYWPILRVPAGVGLASDEMELTLRPDGRYEIDLGAFERAITDRTRIFILCNPHNPIGRVFRREELEQMAEICLRHDIIICSDEIHCDLVFPGSRHLPIASLAPEIADQTITLMAPSKTFNLPGLKCSVAIVQNPELRKKLESTHTGLVHGVNVMGYTAALAAYRDGQAWLDEVLRYLEANLDFLLQYVEAHLPGVTMSRPEGAYLAWLNCREAGIPGNPHEFFLQQARVAVTDGAIFGRGGEGFVRLNFACPR
ncbi:MAG: pyridoxal phosphate-dependent aminotransferase, partial [Anaerolineales bacterium]|nr:pyridoxal phosphate-dependent aminotransferase [Anaerolineales bacterium]